MITLELGAFRERKGSSQTFRCQCVGVSGESESEINVQLYDETRFYRLGIVQI